jgi:hypothetical protein
LVTFPPSLFILAESEGYRPADFDRRIDISGDSGRTVKIDERARQRYVLRCGAGASGFAARNCRSRHIGDAAAAALQTGGVAGRDCKAAHDQHPVEVCHGAALASMPLFPDGLSEVAQRFSWLKRFVDFERLRSNRRGSARLGSGL